MKKGKEKNNLSNLTDPIRFKITGIVSPPCGKKCKTPAVTIESVELEKVALKTVLPVEEIDAVYFYFGARQFYMCLETFEEEYE